MLYTMYVVCFYKQQLYPVLLLKPLIGFVVDWFLHLKSCGLAQRFSFFRTMFTLGQVMSCCCFKLKLFSCPPGHGDRDF